MKEKFRQFMIGRYGTDSLNQFLSIVSIVTFILYLVTSLQIFYLLFFAVWGYQLFRSLSRNISKRTAENYRYYTMKTAVTNTFKQKKNQASARKKDPNYRYYACPQCGQKLRVPRGRGKIEISCPKCGKQFFKKS